jgi:hypothetical protein
MRYVVCLEDDMIRGSIVPHEIRLEEKQVYVPTPMIHELIPPALVCEPIIPTFEVESSSATPNVHEALVIQEPEVTNIVDDDEEENHPYNLENDVPNQENLLKLQRIRKSDIPNEYEIYTSEEIYMDGDITSYEEAMRSSHSSK